ncbi:serine/threonine-protein kinase [Streptomyces filamentosus]|uniref:non-specific serine/threonine protein kinase n=1 Tax=Streptomyces filamentosus TaxID=67294 RepID=A0A919BSN4_STRFL|nr:serine/threonine-protein kinase [Streptomyces filamentosus]GHG07300.1 protein kinase [Streptomyces filamentosus]
MADDQTSYELQPPAGAGPSGAAPAGVPERPVDGGGGEAGAGRLVGGRYRLLERLGAGGMGTVWRAHDEVVDRDVAVKEPRVPEHFTPSERRTACLRMEREARAAARVDHPSVVVIHDVVGEDGRPWIVMELLRGRSLAEVLEEGTVAPQEAARIGLAVLGALTAAHEAGVLHRDVKPGNVMVGRHDRVVLTDFGIAQVEGERKLTETGGFIGSPEYIAPERVLGRHPGPESDLWSLGVTLYQAVEGVSPFRRQTTPSTLQAILLAELPPPRQAGELTALLKGLLRKEPEERLTAQGARPMLHALTASAPPPAHAPTTVDGAPAGRPAGGAWRHRLRGRTGPVAGAVAALTALVVALVLVLSRDGVPDGWRAYDEYRMHLSVAAPADWTIATHDDLADTSGPYRATSYTSPQGDAWIWVDRKEKATETSRAVADRWKDEHERETPPQGGAPRTAKVEPATHQGRDAAVLTETYSENSEGVPRRFLKTLVVVTSGQERVTLAVNVPDGKDAPRTAEDLFGKAVAAFELRSL